MNHYINCHGFKIDHDQFQDLESKMTEFLELCPSDAYSEVSISQVEDSYCVMAEVRYTGGSFFARTTAEYLDFAYERCLDQLYGQMHAWRKRRADFVDPSEHAIAPRILIVDDEETSTKLLETYLKNEGCHITSVTNGAAAINEITSSSYDLVFLDWSMPDMTGGQALLKAEEVNSKIASDDFQWMAQRLPVITFSSHPPSERKLPECRHFRFLGHWMKSSPPLYLAHQTKQTISKLCSEMVTYRV